MVIMVARLCSCGAQGAWQAARSQETTSRRPGPPAGLSNLRRNLPSSRSNLATPQVTQAPSSRSNLRQPSSRCNRVVPISACGLGPAASEQGWTSLARDGRARKHMDGPCRLGGEGVGAATTHY
jgi:hypothetical protein